MKQNHLTQRILFAALLMLVSLATGRTALAQDASHYIDPDGNDWVFQILDGGTRAVEIVSGGIYVSTDLVVPSSFSVGEGGNFTVTGIGAGAFYNNSSLTSVVLPATLTDIGGKAFQNCTSLGSVTIPKGVRSIGASAFNGCTSLSSVLIPDSVQSIGNSAFYQSGLQSIIIPDSVTEFGAQVFRKCSSLQSATIGNGVPTLTLEFASCPNLETVILGSGVTSVVSNSFYDSGNLNTVVFLSSTPPDVSGADFPDSGTTFYVLDGANYTGWVYHTVVLYGLTLRMGAITPAAPVYSDGTVRYYPSSTEILLSREGTAPTGYGAFIGYQATDAAGDDISDVVLTDLGGDVGLVMPAQKATVSGLWVPSESLNLSVNAATVLDEARYVTSFYHGTLDYQLPEGALAYTAEAVDGDLVFYRIGENSDVIPHGTAVVIVAAPSALTDGKLVLTRLGSTDVTARDTNILTGSDTAVPTPAGAVYVLNGNDSGGMDFFHYTGEVIPAGKAYFVVNE